MFRHNGSAMLNYQNLDEDKQKIVLDMLKMLEGLRVGDAHKILYICDETIKKAAVVKL